MLVLKGRQLGFSLAGAALAVHTAMSGPGADVVLVSATQRQASDLGLKARNGLWALGVDLDQDAATVLRVAETGARIISLSASERAVRGYSARLLLVDEAASLKDAVWEALAPVTAAMPDARTVVQSTAGYPVGFFYDLWSNPDGWTTLRVPAEGVLDADYLERRKRTLSPEVYSMEYGADFAAVASVGRWFSEEQLDAAVDDRFEAITIKSKE